MKRNAFTLIEMISIIVLLSIMFTLVLPGIKSSIKSRKQSQYDNLISTVKSAAKVYYADNQDVSLISVATLINEDYLSSGLTNPITNETINGCVLIEPDSQGFNVYTYYEDCNDVP